MPGTGPGETQTIWTPNCKHPSSKHARLGEQRSVALPILSCWKAPEPTPPAGAGSYFFPCLSWTDLSSGGGIC